MPSQKAILFVAYYQGEAKGNGTKAARLAGYTGADNVLATTAYSLLRKPQIQEMLRAGLESNPLIAGKQERLEFISAVLRGEVFDEKLDKEGGRIELRCSTADRIKAYEALCKAAGEAVALQVTHTVDSKSDAELRAALAGIGVEAAVVEGDDDEDV